MRILLLITMLVAMLFAQNREALLIGNSDYEIISTLKDPSQNLARLKKSLKKLGFTVVVKNDLDAKKLKQSIDNFARRLAKNRDTIGFLYYSGHGCQMDNVGYLIPTNVDSNKKIDVQYDAMNIDKMLATLSQAGNRVNMLFLDACRNETPTGTKGGTKGLPQAPRTPKGTLVVYATEAKKTADDNDRFINSLIAQIGKPNKSIRQIGYGISDDVAEQSSEQQVPEVFAKRVPDVVLKSAELREETRRVDLSTSNPNIVPMYGLMYQNQPFTKEYTWQKAKDYCEDLTLDGHIDWRLPNRKELRTLLTRNKNQGQEKKYYIRPEFVKNLRNYAWFWSSITDKQNPPFAGYVRFNDGDDGYYRKTSTLYALCVR